MKPMRILALVPDYAVPPESLDGMSEREITNIKMEYDVVTTLQNMGHDVQVLGCSDDLGVIRRALEEFKPRIAFNMLEDFHGVAVYDQHVVSFLELMRKSYTGCNPRGMLLARDKALSKKILAYHRIRVPRFAVFARKRKVKRPNRLRLPLVVKSVVEEGSLGIAQASVVRTDEQLAARVEFVHEQLGTDAIAEEFIEGRELYVGMIGNRRLQAFPIWELHFDKMPDDAERIATAKVKWDLAYQKRWGIKSGAAKDLPDGAADRIQRLAKRVYRVLNLSGYARLDMRLTESGDVYVLEANPNPDLSYDEDFAESANAIGLKFDALLERILSLGLRYQAEWKQ
jgi:D-alanine-D-alanine ligase